MALPKDGYPASSKGYDIRDIVKDYNAEKTKSRAARAITKFRKSVKKLPPTTSDVNPRAEAAKTK